MKGKILSEPGAATELDDEALEELVATAEQVVVILESVLEILQAAQASVPAPTLEDLAEIRQGKRLLTREAYLLGLFQLAVVAAENLVSDLRTVDPETLCSVHEVRLSGVQLNAIEEAIAERASREGHPSAGTPK